MQNNTSKIGSGLQSAPSIGTQIKEIPAGVVQCRESLTDISQLLDTLESRLYPVLGPLKDGTEELLMDLARTDLGGELSRMNMRHKVIEARIRAIIDNLEI